MDTDIRRHDHACSAGGAITNSARLRDNALMMSSATPSEKYSCFGSPLTLVKGNTAIEGLSHPYRDRDHPHVNAGSPEVQGVIGDMQPVHGARHPLLRGKAGQGEQSATDHPVAGVLT